MCECDNTACALPAILPFDLTAVETDFLFSMSVKFYSTIKKKLLNFYKSSHQIGPLKNCVPALASLSGLGSASSSLVSVFMRFWQTDHNWTVLSECMWLELNNSPRLTGDSKRSINRHDVSRLVKSWLDATWPKIEHSHSRCA